MLGPILALLLAAYIYGLAARIQWVAMVAGPLLFVAACYGVLAYLWPNSRYRSFLRDMETGLSRDVRGVRNAGWRLAIQIYSPNAAKRDTGLAEMGYKSDYNITDLMEIPGIIRKVNEEG